MRAHLLSLLLAVSTFVATPITAHEMWLQPTSFQIEPGDVLEADIRVGQDFVGGRFGYFPDNFLRFDVALAGVVAGIDGRIGDRPAAKVQTQDNGLHVLIYETTKSSLTYREKGKFEKFVKHKDFTGVMAEHAARGLPEVGFVEIYSRHVKSLIAVGDAQGQDRAFGLETEIVAMANPYTDDVSAGFPVTVLYRDRPRADVQVEIFEKAPDETVKVMLTRTNGLGQAIIPVKAGHTYNLDVVLIRATDGPKDAVWDTLWAGLTFMVPE